MKKEKTNFTTLMCDRKGVPALCIGTMTTSPEVPDFSLVRFVHHGTNHCVENIIRVKHYSGTLSQLIPYLGSRVYRYIVPRIGVRQSTSPAPVARIRYVAVTAVRSVLVCASSPTCELCATLRLAIFGPSWMEAKVAD